MYPMSAMSITNIAMVAMIVFTTLLLLNKPAYGFHNPSKTNDQVKLQGIFFLHQS
jgi:hypothetical protein